jgi:pyruvate kinase
MLHHVALRETDIRDLQNALAELGLSSLGRAESPVISTLDAVLQILRHWRGVDRVWHEPVLATVNFAGGSRLLEAHTGALLGPPPHSRRVRIMVTMATDAADDYLLVRDLLKHGMNCMRINCAHDNPETWAKMIGHLARARRDLAMPCRVLMDLGGPKLRTGAIGAGPAVASWHPHRNVIGEVVAPARIALYPDDASLPTTEAADVALPVPERWLSALRVGDRIELADARGRSRTLRVTGSSGNWRWAEGIRNGYVIPGTILRHVGASTKGEARVGSLQRLAGELTLHAGDSLMLTREETPGHGPILDDDGHVTSPASVSCTLPEVFGQVKPGERIWFDDGKIAGMIREVAADWIRVEIIHAKPKGTKLASDKGINLPDSDLDLAALTARDL